MVEVRKDFCAEGTVESCASKYLPYAFLHASDVKRLSLPKKYTSS